MNTTTDTEIRKRILCFANDRFLQMGFSKVTLDEIAADLGMSKKTLYKFFQNKEELLRESILARLLSIETIIQTISTSKKPFPEKMAEVMITIGTQTCKITKSFQHDIQKFTPELWTEIETFRREHLLNKVEQMILRAQKEKIFRPDIDAKLLVLFLQHSVQGIMNPEVLSQQSFSAQEAFRSIFKIIFLGSIADSSRKEFKFLDTITPTI